MYSSCMLRHLNDLSCFQVERASAMSLASKMVQAAKFQVVQVIRNQLYLYIKSECQSLILFFLHTGSPL